MLIIDAMKWCLENPNKIATLAPTHKFRFSFCTPSNAFIYVTDEIYAPFDVNEFDFDDDGWEVFVEMVPLSDLFGKWCEGDVQIQAHLEDGIWNLDRDILQIYKGEVDNRSRISWVQREIMLKALWSIKEGE